jgi:Secretion system C-terminal sorting domain
MFRSTGVTCQVSQEVRVGGRVTPPNPVSIEIYDVSPNPAGDDIMVSIKSNIAAGTTLVIADLRSNYLLKQAVNVEIGDNKAPFDISSLQAGFYLVYLYYDNQIVSRAKFQKI